MWVSLRLVDAKIRTSDKDLPVIFLVGVIATSSGVMTIFLGFGVSVLILIAFKLVLATLLVLKIKRKLKKIEKIEILTFYNFFVLTCLQTKSARSI